MPNRNKPDWVGLVEAAGAPAPDDEAWGRRIIAASTSLFALPGFLGCVMLNAVQHDASCTQLQQWLSLSNWGTVEHGFARPRVEHTHAAFGPGLVRALYYPDRVVVWQSEIIRSWPELNRSFLAESLRSLGAADCLGVVVQPTPGQALVLGACFKSRPQLTPRHRRWLTQVGLHLEASHRMRSAPQTVLAVVRPDGRVLHQQAGAPTPATLVRHARGIERARLRSHRADPDSLALWRVLVEGRASMVEREEHGRRLYYVVANAPARQPARGLTPQELETVSQAARGLSGKLIAYTLDLSEGAVSERLASAAAKLGVCTRLELVRIAATLARDPRAPFDDAQLTAAEGDVLTLLEQGLSNREIARVRHRSVRTIANQVSRLLRKTNSAGRRVLATKALAAARSP